MRKFLAIALLIFSQITAAYADPPVVWNGTTAKWLPSGLRSAGIPHLSSAGVMTSSAIVNADISASAAIGFDKLASTTASRMAIFNLGGILQASSAGFSDAGILSATGFSGPLTGNVTGNVTGNLTGNVTGDVSGNAGTATALASNPSDCAANTYATTIAANGNLTCSTVSDTGLASSYVLANGTRALSANWNAGAFDITASTFIGALTGNSSTASALAANPSDCAADTYATTIAASGNLTCASITNAATTATASNDNSTIVLRDGSGNFAAGTITAALTGNASTASALASNPSDCSANQYANAIAANGNLTCSAISAADLPGPTSASVASTDIDWSTLYKTGGLYAKTLTANTTFTFSNRTAGQTITVILTNTASNYTVTWPTVKWCAGASPTMTTGDKSDIYTFIYNGTSNYGCYTQNH